jgi:hypothetical protein
MASGADRGAAAETSDAAVAESRKQKAESRKQKAESRKQKAERAYTVKTVKRLKEALHKSGFEHPARVRSGSSVGDQEDPNLERRTQNEESRNQSSLHSQFCVLRSAF